MATTGNLQTLVVLYVNTDHFVANASLKNSEIDLENAVQYPNNHPYNESNFEGIAPELFTCFSARLKANTVG